MGKKDNCIDVVMGNALELIKIVFDEEGAAALSSGLAVLDDATEKGTQQLGISSDNIMEHVHPLPNGAPCALSPGVLFNIAQIGIGCTVSNIAEKATSAKGAGKSTDEIFKIMMDAAKNNIFRQTVTVDVICHPTTGELFISSQDISDPVVESINDSRKDVDEKKAS